MSQRTLRVFEHQTVRVGEKLPDFCGGTIALREPDFDALVRFNDAQQSRFFRVGHRRITFQEYVGYIQVGDLGIEILPKTDRAAAKGGDPARWHDCLVRMLEVALGMRLASPTSTTQKVARSSLLDLVIQRFACEVERILHEGLARGYRTEESNGSTFRGRMLFPDHIRQNVARADRFFVRYQVYDRDVRLNQLLGEALEAAASLPLTESVAARIAECRAAFPEVSRLRSVAGAFDRLTLGRSTERYREALVLARMILEKQMPQLRAGSVPVFGLLFDMNDLWERFVAALFRRAKVPGLTITTQTSVGFWKPAGQRTRTIRPDIVVRSGPATTLAIDTKWKVPHDGSPADADLKQMFAYNELLGAPKALLVYPSGSEGSSSRQGRFCERYHECQTIFLGLFDAQGWSEARMQKEVGRLLVAHQSPHVPKDISRVVLER